ncbi:MAG: hypothetical protein R3C14_13190 [Caldilineaceae bacterium]
MNWMPNLIFSSVNKKLAWRLLLPMMIITGISGVGGQEKVLPNLWDEILPAIERNVEYGAANDMAPYFAASFVFSILGILFLIMVLTRAVDLQLVYLAGRASFALSLLWLVCALMSVLPPSLMGLHRIFIVLIVAATIASQFIRGGTIKYYWMREHYGDLVVQIVMLATYMVFAWIPLRFALTGS